MKNITGKKIEKVVVNLQSMLVGVGSVENDVLVLAKAHKAITGISSSTVAHEALSATLEQYRSFLKFLRKDAKRVAKALKKEHKSRLSKSI